MRILFTIQLILLLSFCGRAQDRSYIKCQTGYKDLVTIIGPDSLKFDMHIYYFRGAVSMICLKGNIGLVSRYSITNSLEVNVLFGSNAKSLVLNIPYRQPLPANDSSGQPHMIPYQVANYIYDTDCSGKFSKERIDSMIKKINFHPLSFRFGNTELVFDQRKKERQLINMDATYAEVFFSRNDLRNVYVYDEGNLIWSFNYRERQKEKKQGPLIKTTQ